MIVGLHIKVNVTPTLHVTLTISQIVTMHGIIQISGRSRIYCKDTLCPQVLPVGVFRVRDDPGVLRAHSGQAI